MVVDVTNRFCIEMRTESYTVAAVCRKEAVQVDLGTRRQTSVHAQEAPLRRLMQGMCCKLLLVQGRLLHDVNELRFIDISSEEAAKYNRPKDNQSQNMRTYSR